MKLNKRVRLNLLAKVLAAVSVLMAVTFGAVGYYQLREARSTIVAMQVANARAFASTLASALEREGSITGPNAARVTKIFRDDKDISEILILDKTGRIVQFSGRHQEDTHYTGDDSRITLETGRSTWSFENHEGARGQERRLDVTWPIHLNGEIVGAVEISASSDLMDKSLRTVASRTLLIDLAGTLVLFVGIVLVVSRTVLRPVAEITRGTENMAAGYLDQMVSIHSGDEFEDLAKAFNRMSRTLKAKQSELETLATTDPLTGLANRRRFYEFIDEEIARQGRYGGQFAICVVDIDFFKNYNDEYGHIAGDMALKEIAVLLQANIRDSDLAARVGGEEFALVLAAQGQEEAQAVALRLLTAVRGHKFEVTPDAKLTVSAGVAVYPDDGKSAQLAIKKADDALYQAKREGRNRAVISTVGRLS